MRGQEREYTSVQAQRGGKGRRRERDGRGGASRAEERRVEERR